MPDATTPLILLPSLPLLLMVMLWSTFIHRWMCCAHALCGGTFRVHLRLVTSGSTQNRVAPLTIHDLLYAPCIVVFFDGAKTKNTFEKRRRREKKTNSWQEICAMKPDASSLRSALCLLYHKSRSYFVWRNEMKKKKRTHIWRKRFFSFLILRCV